MAGKILLFAFIVSAIVSSIVNSWIPMTSCLIAMTIITTIPLFINNRHNIDVYVVPEDKLESFLSSLDDDTDDIDDNQDDELVIH